jgi:hypothetical protein
MRNSVENIGQRLQAFIDHLEISNNKFGEKLGLSGSVVSHIVHGNNFGIDKLIKILDNYPELDLDWLITGKGSMLKVTKKNSVPDTSYEINMVKENEFKGLENTFLKEQLKGKENELKTQLALINALQEIINMMKNNT